MRQLFLIGRSQDTPLTRLLSALGANFTLAPVEQAIDCSSPLEKALIIKEEELAQAQQIARSRDTNLSKLFEQFACVLVYAMRGKPTLTQALSEWSGYDVKVNLLPAGRSRFSCAQSKVCGPFAGLQLSGADTEETTGIEVENAPSPVEHLIKIGELGFLTKVSLPATELFIVSSSSVFDVNAEVFGNLSTSACFSGLVPLLLFLRHSEVVQWRVPRRWANVTIDDPALKPDYGFLNFRKLAMTVRELGCAVSIGFIPWNHTRTSPEVVELIRSLWPKLSLAVHGCDHTGSEFSTQTVQQAQQLINLGMDRMQQLSARTGLRHDKVMVFPQGQFSTAAMQALRQSDLLATVNTELVDRQTGRGVRAAELLKPAITSYAGFPLFLRRPAEDPIENFALDLLLEKPCLIVTHHDFYRNGMQPLTSLVHALNTLVPYLEWTNLESIVSQSVWVRVTPGNTTEIRLFSAVSDVAPQDSSQATHFSKVEPLRDKLFQVIVEDEVREHAMEAEHISFSNDLKRGQPLIVEVKLSPVDHGPTLCPSLRHRAKVAARRYLSEFRDTYIAKSPSMTAAYDLGRNIIRHRT